MSKRNVHGHSTHSSIVPYREHTARALPGLGDLLLLVAREAWVAVARDDYGVIALIRLEGELLERLELLGLQLVDLLGEDVLGGRGRVDAPDAEPDRARPGGWTPGSLGGIPDVRAVDLAVGPNEVLGWPEPVRGGDGIEASDAGLTATWFARRGGRCGAICERFVESPEGGTREC